MTWHLSHPDKISCSLGSETDPSSLIFLFVSDMFKIFFWFLFANYTFSFSFISICCIVFCCTNYRKPVKGSLHDSLSRMFPPTGISHVVYLYNIYYEVQCIVLCLVNILNALMVMQLWQSFAHKRFTTKYQFSSS